MEDLKNYRKKTSKKQLCINMPIDLVDFIGSEVSKRSSNSFTGTLIELLKERKESIENDNIREV